MNSRASTTCSSPLRPLRGMGRALHRLCIASILPCKGSDQKRCSPDEEDDRQPQQDLRYQFGHRPALGNQSYLQISESFHLKHWWPGVLTSAVCCCTDSVSLLGKVPSELPDRHSGEHIPDTRVQNCCDGARQLVVGAYRQLQRLSKDQQAAEHRERGRDGARGGADELARLHSAASDLNSRGCPVPSGNRAALLTIAE
jgi:hypothetical protein